MYTFHKIIATSFGAGYAPIAPGTLGAIVGAVIYYLLNLIPGEGDVAWFSNIHFIFLILVFTGLGIVSTKVLEPIWGHDPSKIVMDETVGLWISLLFVPFSIKYLLAGLVLFRFFDIAKPLFIRKLEKLPHGFGVMGDDILAGIYSNIVLQGLIYYGF